MSADWIKSWSAEWGELRSERSCSSMSSLLSLDLAVVDVKIKGRLSSLCLGAPVVIAAGRREERDSERVSEALGTTHLDTCL